jgi:N-formylmaleamate deformylase
LGEVSFCDTGSASIHYLRTGGSKPPLILLHGLTGNGACWNPVARFLESNFDVLMPDARGHGKSSAPPTFLSPQRQREVFASNVVDQHRHLLSRNKSEVLADLRARHPHRSSEMADLLADARLQTSLHAFDVLTPPNPDYESLVSTIRVPILIALGHAPVVSLETARHLQSLNPHVRIEQIQNAGHGLPYDQPERLAAVVSSFLSSH